MFTSNFARIKTLTTGLVPVSISRRPPYWFKGLKEFRLAPLEEVLFADTWEEYRIGFEKQMAALDLPAVYRCLPANAVLLCFESPTVRCHRRWVAELFEQAMGVEIPEFGFLRKGYPAFKDMLTKDDYARRRKSVGGERPTHQFPW